MSLSELQTELLVGHTVEASLQTIIRSLQLKGYTMKTVCFIYFCLINADEVIIFDCCSSRGPLWT